MKFKKMPENVFHNIQINPNAGDNGTKSHSDEKIYLLMNKLDTSFVVYLVSKKPIPKDRDIYFMSPDGLPYKAKKETLEFMSHYRIKAEFEQIKEEETDDEATSN